VRPFRRRRSKLGIRRGSRRGNSIKSMLRLLPNLVKLIFRLFTDSRVSVFDRALFAVVIAYVLSPFDLLPDWLGVFGLTDDLYLVGLSLARLLHNAGPDLLLEHWDGKPKALGFLIESVEDVGSVLPRSVRSVLRGTVKGP
jgi:uncharacterized membrane protein YkvA (DUF1232 family)